jgi:transcriptional regulator with XRE-family HTH domain
MGVSPATWSEWESDKQIPRIDAALRLADMTAQAVSLEDMAKAASRARAAMKLRHERGAA